MAINRNAYTSLLESVNNAVNPQVEQEDVETIDEIDEILAEGIELYGEEGMEAILSHFAETGEISEELAELLEQVFVNEPAVMPPPPPQNPPGYPQPFQGPDGNWQSPIPIRRPRRPMFKPFGIDPQGRPFGPTMGPNWNPLRVPKPRSPGLSPSILDHPSIRPFITPGQTLEIPRRTR